MDRHTALRKIVNCHGWSWSRGGLTSGARISITRLDEPLGRPMTYSCGTSSKTPIQRQPASASSEVNPEPFIAEGDERPEWADKYG